MVPLMTQKDLQHDVLQVFAEEYNTLCLDKMAFKNPIPEIEGLAPKGKHESMG
jgi:mannitol-1-phosphate 5-dehydrogenase